MRRYKYPTINTDTYTLNEKMRGRREDKIRRERKREGRGGKERGREYEERRERMRNGIEDR